MSVKTIGANILKGVEYPFTQAFKIEHVLATAIKDQPKIKDAIITLVKKCEVIAADCAKDIAEKGLSLPDDMATILAVEDLGSYVKATVIPLILSVYGEIVTDIAAK